ncbi:MAG: corrinoid protein [Dehalococcoidia bacterium]|nr:MAG: corrinoid protein [Dehalococcoidia bacterium]
MSDYRDLEESILNGEDEKVQALVKEYIDQRIDPMQLMTEGLITPMSIVGSKMKSGDMFIPEVLASAQAMRRGLELIKPLIVGEESSIYIGKVVLGTVEGDLHNIGKNIVSLMLESVGFNVIDVGEDINANKFIEIVKQENPDILGLSALLTTTMPCMKEVIEKLKDSGLREKIKVMVGGAPVTQEFANSIGADGYASEAGSAAEKAKQLLGK